MENSATFFWQSDENLQLDTILRQRLKNMMSPRVRQRAARRSVGPDQRRRAVGSV